MQTKFKKTSEDLRVICFQMLVPSPSLYTSQELLRGRRPRRSSCGSGAARRSCRKRLPQHTPRATAAAPAKSTLLRPFCSTSTCDLSSWEMTHPRFRKRQFLQLEEALRQKIIHGIGACQGPPRGRSQSAVGSPGILPSPPLLRCHGSFSPCFCSSWKDLSLVCK